MKTVLLSCAGALLLAAATLPAANAQMGMGGGGSGMATGGGGGGMGGGGSAYFRSGGMGGGQVYRGSGGPRITVGPAYRRGGIYVGPPRYHTRRYAPVVRFGFAPHYGYRYADGGCWRWRLVPTPYGWAYRWVNVCRPPIRFVYPYPLY